MSFRAGTRLVDILSKLPGYIAALPLTVIMRLVRPFILIRLGVLTGNRLGHFAANTEIYLCERNAGINLPPCRHIDLFCIYGPVCNEQLATMWKRVLHVLPAWLLAPMIKINRWFPGWGNHVVSANSHSERDVHNLLDRFPPHLSFNAEEEKNGLAQMRAMGIPDGARVVCLMVRDSAYLESKIPGDWARLDFRDSGIQNYTLTAVSLANLGFVVVRMGAKVRNCIREQHPRIIDYAANGMRNEFMDIFLGAKCEFCISTGTGWDAVPAWLFRKPAVYVNYSVIGLISSYTPRFLFLMKRYHHKKLRRPITLREIFAHDAGYCMSTSALLSREIELIENTPEEILAATMEMVARLNNAWLPESGDEALRKRFLEIFPISAVDAKTGRKYHGEFRALVSTGYLRRNREWLH